MNIRKKPQQAAKKKTSSTTNRTSGSTPVQPLDANQIIASSGTYDSGSSSSGCSSSSYDSGSSSSSCDSGGGF